MPVTCESLREDTPIWVEIVIVNYSSTSLASAEATVSWEPGAKKTSIARGARKAESCGDERNLDNSNSDNSNSPLTPTKFHFV